MITESERLKDELTDKYVVVSEETPELRRFVGLTGLVKTVNMNGRALVQFDGAVDIGWYDIDPSFLTVVDKPLPKKKEEPAAKPKAATSKPAAKAGGKSPLEMARAQGAAGAAKSDGGGEKKLSPLEMARQQGAAGAAPAAKPAESGGKKLSPLEMARQQGAAGAKKEDAPAAPPTGEKKLSPLELARQQGAAKDEAAPAEPEPAAEEPAVEEPVAEAPPAAEEKPAAASGGAATPGSTAEIIALAREQGAFKG